jgi:6-pyruvoyltetrahydropterin/6-carboxytetrahydropterin synthase
MLYLTRRETFNAGHRLFRPEWSDEENYQVYGKCSNPGWHGHNYILYVTVKGNLNSETGFVVNLKTLSGIIREHVIDKIDHMNINNQVDFMKGKLHRPKIWPLPSGVYSNHHMTILGIELHCIRIVETENNYIEYYGNQKGK